MDKKTVLDVIGAPESWQHYLNRACNASPDLRGAIISHVFSCGNLIAIQTYGAACGTTFSIFVIEDRDLFERTKRALREGVEVHAAVAAAI